MPRSRLIVELRTCQPEFWRAFCLELPEVVYEAEDQLSILLHVGFFAGPRLSRIQDPFRHTFTCLRNLESEKRIRVELVSEQLAAQRGVEQGSCVSYANPFSNTERAANPTRVD